MLFGFVKALSHRILYPLKTPACGVVVAPVYSTFLLNSVAVQNQILSRQINTYENRRFIFNTHTKQ